MPKRPQNKTPDPHLEIATRLGVDFYRVGDSPDGPLWRLDGRLHVQEDARRILHELAIEKLHERGYNLVAVSRGFATQPITAENARHLFDTGDYPTAILEACRYVRIDARTTTDPELAGRLLALVQRHWVPRVAANGAASMSPHDRTDRAVSGLSLEVAIGRAEAEEARRSPSPI